MRLRNKGGGVKNQLQRLTYWSIAADVLLQLEDNTSVILSWLEWVLLDAVIDAYKEVWINIMAIVNTYNTTQQMHLYFNIVNIYISYLTWGDLSVKHCFSKETCKQGRLLCEPENTGVNPYSSPYSSTISVLGSFTFITLIT